eukprot:3784510-Prymnesium_polylepis.1
MHGPEKCSPDGALQESTQHHHQQPSFGFCIFQASPWGARTESKMNTAPLYLRRFIQLWSAKGKANRLVSLRMFVVSLPSGYRMHKTPCSSFCTLYLPAPDRRDFARPEFIPSGRAAGQAGSDL